MLDCRELILFSLYFESQQSKQAAAAEPQKPTELTCRICGKLMSDAVLVPCCGKSFCKECTYHDAIGARLHLLFLPCLCWGTFVRNQGCLVRLLECLVFTCMSVSKRSLPLNAYSGPTQTMQELWSSFSFFPLVVLCSSLHLQLTRSWTLLVRADRKRARGILFR